MLRRTLGTALAFVMLAATARAQVARDAIDMSQVAVYNSPRDIASWPITHAITGLEMQPSGAPLAGLSFTSSALSAWPDYWPPGWDGPLQYTVWAVVKVNGQWYTSGFIQMWRGRPSTGGPILTDFAINWAYDSRWGPMQGHQPVVGEQMGFFLSAGNARGVTTVTSVRERTNVVVVSLPANDTGSFTFSPLASPTASILGADFNNDGQSDLLAQSAGGRVSLALNSAGTFTEVQSPFNGVVSDWRIIDIGDFNGDGRPDLVWQHPSGPVVVWLNNPSGPPSGVNLFSGATAWRVAAVADINRDGRSDLIWQAPTGQVVVWFMNGTTVSGSQTISSVESQWRIVGARDFNGDGNWDLVWQSPTGAVVVWLMNGAAMGSAQYVFNGASVWQVASVGDFNADGKPDLFWKAPTGQLLVWVMNGFSAVQYRYINPTASGWVQATP